MGGFVSKPSPPAPPKPQPVKPTAVEVTASQAAEAQPMATTQEELGVKRKGRRATIATGAAGVLGGTSVTKKTLLG